MARKLFRRFLPSADEVRTKPALRWLGPLIHHPSLWHVNRRGIALGLAIGVFMGLIIPIGQIPVAALLAWWLRANLPLAVVSTLITNPFTFPPIYFLAYKIGALLLGHRYNTVTEETLALEFTGISGWLTGWWETLVALGPPLMVGLVVLATATAFTAYWCVIALWRVHVYVHLWRRRRGPARQD